MPRITSSNSSYIANYELASILGIGFWHLQKELNSNGSFAGFTPTILNGRWVRWKKDDIPEIKKSYEELALLRSLKAKVVSKLKTPLIVADDAILELTTSAMMGSVHITWREFKEKLFSEFQVNTRLHEIINELNTFGRWRHNENGDTIYVQLLKA